MPRNLAHDMQSNGYQSGFANEFASEAVAGTLPQGQNSPQQVAHGLYAEQLSGTAFTAPRHLNRRSWLYRIRPAAVHRPFQPRAHATFHNRFDEAPATPNQLRWSPFALPAAPMDFIDGLWTIAGNGSAAAQAGVGIHLYGANRDMQGRYFYNADGELLIVPQQGRLSIATELGVLELEPQEIAVIPRGVRFRVALPDGSARGYVCENFGALLRLPELGPIGSNGLANARDFRTPVAAFEQREGDFELVAKFQGALWRLPDLGPIGSNGLANPRDFLTPNAAFEDAEGDFELFSKSEIAFRISSGIGRFSCCSASTSTTVISPVATSRPSVSALDLNANRMLVFPIRSTRQWTSRTSS